MGSTKEEIMTVALHLFAKNGYEAVSVSQIAGVLGMTKERYTDIMKIRETYFCTL